MFLYRLGADYYVDIDVNNKKIFFKGMTKGGVPDWKIKDNVDATDIIEVINHLYGDADFIDVLCNHYNEDIFLERTITLYF